MPRVLVTGAAGFVGSHTVEAAASAGHDVIAVDSFNDYYDPAAKRRNANHVSKSSGIRIRNLDLLTTDLDGLLSDVEVVVHLAGQPGVRSSWSDFGGYLTQNVALTDAILQSCHRVGVGRVVYASSSSVYGNADVYPVAESAPTVPSSPYGVTKLAGELLCRAYAENFGLSTVSLRYFTVYGPRQRPDMAIQRLIRAALDGSPFTLHGDGRQIRDFTFVADVVAANVAAISADVAPGTVVNISGGSSTDMLSVIDQVEVATQSAVQLLRGVDAPGDVRQTGGDHSQARALLGWIPEHSLAQGIAEQAAFEMSR
jgi:UDP-glucuronate 4-epimerase